MRSISEYPALRAGIFKASGSADPMKVWAAQKRWSSRLPFIVSTSPPGYPWPRSVEASASANSISFGSSMGLEHLLFESGRAPVLPIDEGRSMAGQPTQSWGSAIGDGDWEYTECQEARDDEQISTSPPGLRRFADRAA